MKRSSKEPKPSAESIILAYVTHPITISLMTVIDCATDEELTAYGTIAGNALAQLVKWAKRAPVNMAIGIDVKKEIRAWFYNEHVPKRVQDLLTRIGGLLAI
jgi:hypothetical protein